MILMERRERLLKFVLVSGVVLLNIKRLVADYTIDVEYAIAMAYRMAMGDHLLTQMWEPHQTAAVFLAFFVKPWMALTKSTTGMVLYLNVISLSIKGGVNAFLYCTLRKFFDSKVVFYICIFFMAVNTKHCLILDFSNLQIYFTILMFCGFVRYFGGEQKNKRWLLAAAVFLCLAILSYPSCVLLYCISVYILMKFSERKKMDFALFTGVCIGMGAGFLLCAGLGTGFAGLFDNLYWIVTGDATHSQNLGVKLLGYGKNIAKLGLAYGGIAFVGMAVAQIAWLLRHRGGDQKRFPAPLRFYLTGFGVVLLGYSLINVLFVRFEFQFAEMYLPIMVWGGCLLSHCGIGDQRIVKIGLLLSVGNFLSVIMLTNNNFYTVIPYFILGVMAALIPILHFKGGEKWAVLSIGLTILKGIYVMMPLSVDFSSIFEAGGIITSGPSVGIISDYMGAYTRNTERQFWEQYIMPGDNVLIVAENRISSIQYLYEDVNICVDSTISTPTFSEKLVEYWTRNPDKVPNVVVVECWFGEYKVDDDSWIMQWLRNDFGMKYYMDGKYQRYFFAENRERKSP